MSTSKNNFNTVEAALKNNTSSKDPTQSIKTSKVDQSAENDNTATSSTLASSSATSRKKSNLPTATSTTSGIKASSEETPTTTRKFASNTPVLDKNEQVKRLEQDVQKLVLWQNPVRSGAYFVLILAGLILSKSYSLIQLLSAVITFAIAINLVYVNVTIQTQRILADRPGVNPYSSLLQDESLGTMDRHFLQRSTELIADVVEAVLQRLSSIILIENTKSSTKWLAIFYTIWKLSAIISVRTLATLITFLAFSVPLLYRSNKSFIDSRILQAQAICQTQLEHGQDKIQHQLSQLCTRFKFPQPGPSTSTTSTETPSGTSSSSTKED
ncbi:Reticulon-domain-containing protein [Halteromyces radiatus]|uniref:Reticulon-domain-containing protein n=1 Tax=Halteromyces radiatus TaxID=101107 RepID=UPI00221F8468|nr:Reticulon-domain-containing protein [Halteromyces radiatus]KAI8096812.1 Reticulon-domain-containing protein [Halteromyces radiatus]